MTELQCKCGRNLRTEGNLVICECGCILEKSGKSGRLWRYVKTVPLPDHIEQRLAEIEAGRS